MKPTDCWVRLPEQDNDFQDQVLLLYLIYRTFISKHSNVQCLLLSIQLITAKKFVTATWAAVTEQKHSLNFSQGYIYRQRRGSVFRLLGDYFLRTHTHKLWVLPLPRKELPEQPGAQHWYQASALCSELQLLHRVHRLTSAETQMLQTSTAHKRFKTFFPFPTDHQQTVLVFLFSPQQNTKTNSSE